MKVAVFTLPETVENRTFILNNRYRFVNGEYRCSEIDGPLVEKILCVYHGCTLNYVEEKTAPADPEQEGSLAKSITNPNGKVAGDEK